MRIAKSTVRDSVLILIMLGCSLIVYSYQPVKSASHPSMELSAHIPEAFGDWTSITQDTAGYNDQWQSINELLVREYFQKDPFEMRPYAAHVRFIAEYSNDIQRNFSFHFPENCHKAGGNAIEILSPQTIDLPGGRKIFGRSIFIRGRQNSYEKKDKIVTYWLVIGGRRYHNIAYVKLDQMLAGLLTHSKQGVLLRIDYEDGFESTPEGFSLAENKIERFVYDLYDALNEKDRAAFFGEV